MLWYNKWSFCQSKVKEEKKKEKKKKNRCVTLSRNNNFFFMKKHVFEYRCACIYIYLITCHHH